MLRRLTIEAIYLLQDLMKRYQSRGRDLHIVFIDLEKACDRVLKKTLWKALKKEKVHVTYIHVIKDMHNEVKM